MSWYWPFGTTKKPIPEPQIPRTREDAAQIAREYLEKYLELNKQIVKKQAFLDRPFIKKIDFITPLFKHMHDDFEYNFFYVTVAYVFLWTRAYNNSYYNDSNYIHPNLDNDDARDFVVGSSDDSEEEYKNQDFRDTQEYFDYIVPRSIIYVSCQTYTKAVKHAKKIFCKANKIPYVWKVHRSEPRRQKLGLLHCVDLTSPLKPHMYLPWFQKQIPQYKRNVHAVRLKNSWIDFQSYDEDRTFNPSKNKEDKRFYDEVLEEEKIQELYLARSNARINFLLKRLNKNLFNNRNIIIKNIVKWQQKWYKLIGWETKGYIRTLLIKGFKQIKKDFKDHTLDHLKTILKSYLYLYKRDIVYYLAKLDMCAMQISKMSPLKKLALGEYDYYNNVFLIWSKLRYGKFIITEDNLLSVPVLEKYNEKKKKKIEDKDPLENIADLLMGNFEDTEFLEQKKFDNIIKQEEEAYKKRVKKKFNSFQLNFEKEIKILTHLDQNAIVLKRREALKHLMPKEALAADFFKKFDKK